MNWNCISGLSVSRFATKMSSDAFDYGVRVVGEVWSF